MKNDVVGYAVSSSCQSLRRLALTISPRLSSETATASTWKPRDARLAAPMAPCSSLPMAMGPSSVQLQVKVTANFVLAASGLAPASSSVQRRKLPKVQMKPSTQSSR